MSSCYRSNNLPPVLHLGFAFLKEISMITARSLHVQLRCLFGCFVFAIFGTGAPTSAEAQLLPGARYSAQQRAQIRSMPILERPNRPLHFYGNAVRRGGAAGSFYSPTPTYRSAPTYRSSSSYPPTRVIRSSPSVRSYSSVPRSTSTRVIRSSPSVRSSVPGSPATRVYRTRVYRSR